MYCYTEESSNTEKLLKIWLYCSDKFYGLEHICNFMVSNVVDNLLRHMIMLLLT